jgi:hypothetical protein
MLLKRNKTSKYRKADLYSHGDPHALGIYIEISRFTLNFYTSVYEALSYECV